MKDIDEHDMLSDREREILCLFVTGLSASQVAQRLFLAENTVKTHMKRMYHALGARTIAHAVAVAHEIGALPLACGAPGCGHGSNEPQANRYKHARRPAGPGGRVSKPLPDGVKERYPSIQWGEDEWFAALQKDDDLYFRILTGIGKAVASRRAS